MYKHSAQSACHVEVGMRVMMDEVGMKVALRVINNEETSLCELPEATKCLSWDVSTDVSEFPLSFLFFVVLYLSPI